MPPKSKQAKKHMQAAPPGPSTKAKASHSTTAAAQQHMPNLPDWPPLQPLIPTSDLTLVPLLPEHILTIPHFWTASLSKTYVTFLSSLPLVTTPGKPKKGNAVRVNDRYQVDDPAFAERLWSETVLKDLVSNPVIDGEALNEGETRALWGGEVLGLNGNIRIYRYSKGQFFDQHYDEANPLTFPSLSSPTSTSTPAKTTWTLLLYLSSPATGCQGGETVFYPEPPPSKRREPTPAPVVAELEVGMALLHRHGKDCLLHEGREVTAGEKWVIRSDLCVKR